MKSDNFIHIPAGQTGGTESLQNILQLVNHEMTEKQVGSDTVATRLVDILFVYIARSWLAQGR